jgi:hypothetical protein
MMTNDRYPYELTRSEARMIEEQRFMETFHAIRAEREVRERERRRAVWRIYRRDLKQWFKKLFSPQS